MLSCTFFWKNTENVYVYAIFSVAKTNQNVPLPARILGFYTFFWRALCWVGRLAFFRFFGALV